jgi:hypothetical protein|tara:strand:- start:27 stop:263 length:237 start_codon:yes stop_codon:yes gene_type:complete
MKISRRQLRQIIQEETTRLDEEVGPMDMSTEMMEAIKGEIAKQVDRRFDELESLIYDVAEVAGVRIQRGSGTVIKAKS